MKKMIKKILLLSCLLAILIIPYFVFASTPLEGLEGVQGLSGYAEADETSVASIAGSIVNTALGFLGIIFIVLMIYGGFLWMSDQGNEEQVEKSKKIIRNSIIGLVITISAYAIYAIFLLLIEQNLK